MRARCDPWLVMPYEVEPKILAWQSEFEAFVTVDSVTQWVGLPAYAVTVTDKAVPAERKRAVFFGVPHAHEPAGTAACMTVIEELLTGRGLDGNACPLDRAAVLKSLILCFVPDGNPDGRRRSPVRFWTGERYTNEELWTWMRGRDPVTKGKWERFGRWSTRQHEPDTIGIVYEQISSHEYVEPNRDADSSYVRLLRMLDERYHFERVMPLHQTEFPDSDYKCAILLPVIHPELPEAIRRENEQWGTAVIEAWRRMGANPQPQPHPLGYTGEQAGYFRKVWGEMYHAKFTITTEVQNNNPRTPPDMQVALQAAAIRVTIGRMLQA